MAHQIVATSVPRGLDGVSGYQTVLKSAGIPPRVFDRLKARSGYSHRYPHGDSRNPIVYVHRIEELAGARWHVLGCIRDAGSDHTGRSNFLAHMLGVEAAEARGKPGGPAAAALARGCFLEKWDGPPEPAAAAKTLVAADRPPRAGDAPAWTAAGLDPGLAGDLAAAAMANGKVVLVTRPEDDVLSLFADALRLVEPSNRWSVTFNTCAIEDFDGTWKAVRSDLASAKDLRDGKAVLIDLTKSPRGSGNPYAQFARGETDSLPWQRVAKVAEPDEEAPDTASDGTTTSDGRSPPTGRKPGKPTRTPERREDQRRDRRPRYEEEKPSGVPWHVIAPAVISLLVAAVVLAIPFREQIMSLVQSEKPRPVVPQSDLDPEPVKPAPVDARDTPAYRTATKVKEAKARLEAGEKGVTHDILRDKANDLLARLDLLQREFQPEWPQIIDRVGQGGDPIAGLREAVESTLKKCVEAARVLPDDSGAKPEEVVQAEEEFKAAASGFADLKDQVGRLEAGARAEREHQMAERQKKDEEKLRQKAFQDFQTIGQEIDQDVSLPTSASTGGADLEVSGSSSARRGAPALIDLGAFIKAYLVEPNFRLALPREEIAGIEFQLGIVKVDGPGDPRWEIQYLATAVGADGDRGSAKPRPLASLVNRAGRLLLEVPRSNELNLEPFALLRRSVILAKAKDPAAPEAPPVVQEIRLVEPTKVRPLVIDLFAEQKQVLKIVPPPGIPRTIKAADGSKATLALPIASVRFEATLPGGQKVSHELQLPKDNAEESASGIDTWKIPLVQLKPELAIEAEITLSLPQATLAVETRLTGNESRKFRKEKIKEIFIDEPDKFLKNFDRAFKLRVKTGEAFGFSQKNQPSGKTNIENWFGQDLVNQTMGMPDHAKVRDSFELFLKEKYQDAAKGMRQGQRPDQPQKWEEFYGGCQQVKDEAGWQREFTNRVKDWGIWFWPKFKDQFEANVKLFQGAIAERHEIRITAITSLAYDESGTVYEVPLVVPEEMPASPAGGGPVAPEGDAVGIE